MVNDLDQMTYTVGGILFKLFITINYVLVDRNVLRDQKSWNILIIAIDRANVRFMQLILYQCCAVMI